MLVVLTHFLEKPDNQAHDLPVRSMVWSHNENWMVTGDDGGAIKYASLHFCTFQKIVILNCTLFNPSAEPFEFFSRYWQSNMNNVKVNKTAHRESVRGLRWWLSDAPFLVCYKVHVQCVVCAETCPSNSFSRTDLKFCSCSDDRTVKVWDFARCQEEKSLTGNVAKFFLQILIWHTSHHLKLLCDITLFFRQMTWISLQLSQATVGMLKLSIGILQSLYWFQVSICLYLFNEFNHVELIRFCAP